MEPSQQSAILSQIRGFTDAWNKGYALAAASYFAEDAVRMDLMGDIQYGRQEIAEALEFLIENMLLDARLEPELGSIQMIDPDTAMWEGTFRIVTPGVEDPIRARIVQILKLIDGRWLIVESFPQLPPPPGSP